MYQTRSYWLVVLCSGAVLATSCYDELDGEAEYRELRVNELPRVPNQPPAGAGDGTGSDEATPTDDSTVDDSTVDDSTMDDSTMDDSTMDDSTGGGVFVPPPGCEDVPSALFGVDNKCGGIVCHGNPGTEPLSASDLGNMTDDLVTRLPSASGTGECADFPMVDIANPENSLLITKFNEEPPCGTRMPLSGSISEDERNCIIEWTRAVAAAAQ